MQITEFMQQMKIQPKLTDITYTAGLFREEMQHGLAGEPSCLKMIPAYIGSQFPAAPGEYVIAVDAGGTNLRISLIQFDADAIPQIMDIRRFSMPGVAHPVTCDELFDFLAENIGDFLLKTTRIGFCFSYAVEILPSGDGRILNLSKEVTITGYQGKQIGEELQKALKRKNLPAFTQITIINDTTAALICGQCLLRDRTYSNYIGFILGTGNNICYYEPNKNITKAPLLAQKEGQNIINIESGFFNRQLRGELDEEFLASTKNPDEYHMEKMISGQYLGPLLEKYLKKAAECHVFSPSAAQKIETLNGVCTKDISSYLENPEETNPLSILGQLEKEDAKIASTLIDAMLDRAARLVCSALLGCLMQTDSGRDKDHPVLVLMEGSTYLRFTLLREKILGYVESVIQNEHGYYVDMRHMSDAVTFGTAFAGMRK